MSTYGQTKNIGGDSNDPHYRYKRNLIEVVYIDKKGGLTKLENIETIIIKQLKMPAEFVTAFYKNVKKKGTAMTESGVFRGRIPGAKFEKILDSMIKKFVLCPKCGNPEWAGGPTCPACGYGGSSSSSATVERVEDMVSTMSLESNESDREISKTMNKLYDIRHRLIHNGEDTASCDKVLDFAWVTDDLDKFNKLAVYDESLESAWVHDE